MAEKYPAEETVGYYVFYGRADGWQPLGLSALFPIRFCGLYIVVLRALLGGFAGFAWRLFLCFFSNDRFGFKGVQRGFLPGF